MEVRNRHDHAPPLHVARGFWESIDGFRREGAKLSAIDFNGAEGCGRLGVGQAGMQGSKGAKMGLRKTTFAALLATSLLAGGAAQAQQAQDAQPAAGAASSAADTSGQSTEDLAKKLQNPIGDLYTIPFQSNTNFGFGPHQGTQEILNIQPVIPLHINDDWNIITRTIVPVIWNPSLLPAPSVPQGIGPTTFSAFLSPKNPTNGWLWGVGPVVQIPTITSPTLGSNVWGLGPTAVIVYMGGPIVTGALVNNVWSLGGTSGPNGTKYATFLTQPFFNYNFQGGWFVGTAPIVTANELASGQKWTVPVGAQGGRLIKLFGKLPVNFLVGGYYNVVTPQYGARWQLRTQVAVIF